MNRLPFERHLALYLTFHQAHGNRVVHQLASPFVYFSAMLALHVVLPSVVLPVLLASVAALALADWKGASLFGVSLLVQWVLARWLGAQLSTVQALAFAAVMQGAAWAVLIFLGHGVYEAHLDVGGAPASKGLYFERQYNRGEGLGVKVNLFDRFVQFSIAPLAHTNEVLFMLGLRRGLEQQVEVERLGLVARLRDELTPFAAA